MKIKSADRLEGLAFVGVFNAASFANLMGDLDTTRRFLDGLSKIGLVTYEWKKELNGNESKHQPGNKVIVVFW